MLRAIRPNPTDKIELPDAPEGRLLKAGDKGILRDVLQQFDPEGPELWARHGWQTAGELNQEQTGSGFIQGGGIGLAGGAVRSNGFIAEADGFGRCGLRLAGEGKSEQKEAAGSTGDILGLHFGILAELRGQNKMG